jgi:SagB-type dehydrogenase family enzyme
MAPIGDEYHESTKHRRGRPPGHSWDRRNPPPLFTSYEDALRFVDLPDPEKTGGMGLWEAVQRRRSLRDYKEEPIALRELSQLLWASTGITGEVEGFPLRAAPSAGALYPINTYLAVHRVEGLEGGIYHYNILGHRLELLREGDVRREIAAASLDQEMCARAGAVFVWTATVRRTKWKYGERGYRYIYKDAAHICGNLTLAAAALGLGCCPIGACYDDEVNALLGIDGKEETVVYLASVGRV